MAFALILETGAGVTDANSYCSRAVADAYHDGRLNASAWQTAGEADKDKALAMATALLDEHRTWRGAAVLTREKPAWPRTDMVERTGIVIDSTTIPISLQEATAEFARRLIEADRILQAEHPPQSSSAAGKSRSYAPGQQPSVVPPQVDAMIGHLIIRGESRLVVAA